MRLKYIQRVKDRKGKYRCYFRRRGFPSTPLPDERDPTFFAEYHKVLAATSEPVRQKEQPRTMASLIDHWMRGSRFQQLGTTTQVTYRRILLNMQKEEYASCFVSDFEPIYIRRIIAKLSDRPAAANHRLKLLRMLFDHAIEDGWREDNPATSVKRMKERAEGAETWSEGQIAQYEAFWPTGSVPRLALALLLYTGQRRSDVVTMGAKHQRGDAIQVTQQKTGAALIIPIHASLARELDNAPASGTFLQAQSGNAFTANGFYMRFKEWRARAGLPDGLSPHGLRKAAARRLAEAGCSAHQIAAITGHATLAEVQRYTRAVDQEKLAREAMLRIGLVKRDQ